jgi:hypothetical protein
MLFEKNGRKGRTMCPELEGLLKTHPVTFVGVVVLCFGLLATAIKFLNDVFGFAKNLREFFGEKKEPAPDRQQAAKKAFELGQTRSTAEKILYPVMGGAVGATVAEMLHQHGDQSDWLHGRLDDHGKVGHPGLDDDSIGGLHDGEHLSDAVDADAHSGIADFLSDFFSIGE